MGTTTAIAAKSLNPGELATPNEKRSVVSTEEMLSIQTFIEHGKRLPLTEAALRNATSFEDKFDAPLPDLVAEYVVVNRECIDWDEHIYPRIVGLANDIVHYNARVQQFYAPVIELSDKWSRGDDPTASEVKRYTALLTVLATQATTNATNANSALSDVTTFHDNLEKSQLRLEGLTKDLEKVFGDQGTIITQAAADIAEDENLLKEAEAEYQHDVVVAATTPTYAWLGPLGLIAAATVAGIYGDAAVNAKNNIARLTDLKEGAEKKKAAALRVQSEYARINNNAKGILTDLKAAMRSLEKIGGIWTAISSDLQDIVKTLQDADVSNPTNFPILASDQLKLAEAEWQDVAEKADNFRTVAFIKVHE